MNRLCVCVTLVHDELFGRSGEHKNERDVSCGLKHTQCDTVLMNVVTKLSHYPHIHTM